MNARTVRTRDDFQEAARKFRAGRISLGEFTNRFFSADSLPELANQPPSQSADGLCLDIDRQERCGFPEVIYGGGKSAAVIRTAIDGLIRHEQAVLVTRTDDDVAIELQKFYSNGRIHPQARTFSIGRCRLLPDARIAIVTAGTSDYPVAAESLETLHWMGIDAELIQDVGVAGPQRLQVQLPRLEGCHVAIVVAGFEGALPSVVGGHLDCPVIGVPTSNSYGVGWPGLAPLLAMLNSCAPNVTVVNVDAGFKAGYLAGLIAKLSFDNRRLVPASEFGQLR